MLASAEPMDVASPEQMDGALPKYSPDCEVLAHFRILCAGCWNGSTVDNIVSTVKSLKLFSGLLHLWDICEPSRGALNDWPWIVMGDSGTLWSAKEVISYPEMTDCGLWWGQWHFVVSWGSWGHLLHWSDWLRVVMGDSGTCCGQLRSSSPTLQWMTWIMIGDSGTHCGQLRSSPTLKWLTVDCDGGQWHFVVSWSHLLPRSDWLGVVMGDSGAFCGQLRGSSPTLKWLTQGCGGGQWHMLWSAEGVISYPEVSDRGLGWGTVELSVVSWGRFLPAGVIQTTANCSPLHHHSDVDILLPLKTTPRLCDGTLWQCKSQNWRH